MPQLVGLDGTDGKAQEAGMFFSVSGAFRVLRQGLAATTAADNGAINVYVDDANKYRCEVMRYMVSIDARQFTTQEQVRGWLTKWLPKIQ